MTDKPRNISRYLTAYFMEQSLKRGKGIVQFSGWFDHNSHLALRYLLIYSRPVGFLLSVEEKYDLKTAGFADIAEYPSIHDEDDPIQHSFATLEETLGFATSRYGANREHWVNESMLGDEYIDALSHRPS